MASLSRFSSSLFRSSSAFSLFRRSYHSLADWSPHHLDYYPSSHHHRSFGLSSSIAPSPPIHHHSDYILSPGESPRIALLDVTMDSILEWHMPRAAPLSDKPYLDNPLKREEEQKRKAFLFEREQEERVRMLMAELHKQEQSNPALNWASPWGRDPEPRFNVIELGKSVLIGFIGVTVVGIVVTTCGYYCGREMPRYLIDYIRFYPELQRRLKEEYPLIEDETAIRIAYTVNDKKSLLAD